MKNLLLFPIFFGVIGCSDLYENCNQIKIDKKELSWIKGYNLNDRIILKSNMGNFDTLELIEKRVEFSPCNKFELGPDQYETYDYAFLSTKFKDSVEATAGLSYSTKNEVYGEKEMMIWAFGLNWNTSHLETDEHLHKEMIKLPGINDSIETFKISRSNYQNDIPQIESFSWNKKYGLVNYKTKSGEMFSYLKKL